MGLDLAKELKGIEVSHIKDALSKTSSITEAAKFLKLKRTTLIEKMKKYKIKKDKFQCL